MRPILLSLFIALAFSTLNTSGRNVYHNPVIEASTPDPTIIRGEDGLFYLYATEDIRNVPIYSSKNLVDWNYVTTAFTSTTRPNFEPKAGIWAPDINYIEGRYVMYYSMSVWGGEQTCGVGVAIADSPEGQFTDMGKLFRSNEIGVQNSIDPFYIYDNGKHYLLWGSFWGIYATELSEDGLQLKNIDNITKVAGTAFEGVYVHKREGYYYFIASIGRCCEGLKSTYELVVGRSDNLMGPYVDKNSKPMLENGYTLLLSNNKRFVGNGHCSEIVQDDAGNDWILYHGIEVKEPNRRKLLLDQVKWDSDGWPYIGRGTPSLRAIRPYFK